MLKCQLQLVYLTGGASSVRPGAEARCERAPEPVPTGPVLVMDLFK